MTTKFNIGDTVINDKGVKGKIVDITIDEFGIRYNVKYCSNNFIKLKHEDELTKAPVTREEALAAALKDIGKNISKSVTINLMEYSNFFEVCIKEWGDGAYIGCSETNYRYSEE